MRHTARSLSPSNTITSSSIRYLRAQWNNTSRASRLLKFWGTWGRWALRRCGGPGGRWNWSGTALLYAGGGIRRGRWCILIGGWSIYSRLTRCNGLLFLLIGICCILLDRAYRAQNFPNSLIECLRIRCQFAQDRCRTSQVNLHF